jgi:hypothetical protein
MRSRCVRHLERCFHRLASSTSTPLYARPAFLVAPLTSQRQVMHTAVRLPARQVPEQEGLWMLRSPLR